MDLQLQELERRLNILERSVEALSGDLHPAIDNLKLAVEDLRRQLNDYQSCISKNIGRDMGLPSNNNNKFGLAGNHVILNSFHPYWSHVKYRRKVEEEGEEVIAQFKGLRTSEISQETKAILRLPTFNTWAWRDSELILLLEHMYEELHLTEKFMIDQEVLRSFLFSVYLNYNQVPFHNFRHAFSVGQMMYGILIKCNLFDRLKEADLLILLTSCICHDLDHPGFNNIYQINAKTELALRYNDISPLENHHCAVAFSILERNQSNVLKNLSQDDYKYVREGIIRCILATDMARHNEILQDFAEIATNFDFNERRHVNLLFMMLIKVADISNEARPLDIAEPWLECLMQEFFNQSDLEKLEGLPVSPFMDRDKVTKPSSQCSFIDYVLLPLFEALGEVLPELEKLLIEPVKDALDHYRRLNELTKKLSEDLEDQIKDIGLDEIDESQSTIPEETPDHSSSTNLKKILTTAESFTSIRSRTSSRASGLIRGASSRDTDPDLDPTETEVEVSERTSKFKISSNGTRRDSYEHRGSIERHFSLERTVSPRLLEERLRTHSEADSEVEQKDSGRRPEENKKQNRAVNVSFLSRIRHFSERISSEEKDDEKSNEVATRSPLSAKKLLMKRSKQKETAIPEEPQSGQNFAVDSESRLESDPPSVDIHRQSSGRKRVIPRSAQESPTMSEKIKSSPNSTLRQKKKFSLSLDVLPRKNDRSKKDKTSVVDSQRVSSDDLLAKTSTGLNFKKFGQLHSPRLLKKKHDSSKGLLLRSISFGKKSSSAKDDLSPKSMSSRDHSNL